MADARSKAVLTALEPLYTRTRYLIDRVRDLREPTGLGDRIEIPQIAQLSVTASGASTTAPQAVSTSVLALTVDREPWINSLLPQLDSVQLLDGRWAPQVAEQATIMLKNSMDEHLARDFLAKTQCFDTSGTYHVNVAGDSLIEDDILNAKAFLLAQDGVMQENIGLVVSPYGEASIQSIAGFLPAGQVLEQGVLGIPRVGTVFGIPVFSSNSIQRNPSAAATATSITSNVCTATVAAGHGFVPGMLVYTSGMTTNIARASAVAITSVTATTIVFPLVAANGSNGSAGSVLGISSMNLMLDFSQVFVAQQMYPKTRTVADFQSTGDALQVSTIWGRQSRVGRALVVHSPGSSA